MNIFTTMTFVKIFLKQNLSALVFFAFIGFGIFSLISSNNQIAPQVKDLVTFGQSSLQRINNDFDTIIKTSATIDTTQQSYESIASMIQEAQKKLDKESTSIPNKLSEDTAQQLIKELQTTYKDTKTDYDYVLKRLDSEKNTNKKPVISTTDLRTQNYSKHVQTIQSTVNELVNKYSLK